MKPLLLTILSLSVLAGCGGSAPSVAPSPTPSPAPAPAPAPAPQPAPAPPPAAPTLPNLVGTWAGTMRARYQGAPLMTPIRLELQQGDRTITGTWAITATGVDARGEIRGALEGIGAETTFRGTMTWNSETSSGTGRCLGTATFTGAAVPPALSWSSIGWDLGATCSGAPSEVTWAVVR